MPTLSELRTRLGRYAGAGNSFSDRINSVIARLLPEADCKGSKVSLRFVVYTDANGGTFVTTPRNIEAIRAGTYQYPVDPNSQPPSCWGFPLPVRNGWYESSLSGPGEGVGSDYERGIIPLNGRFTTFAEWTTAVRLRFTFETTESPGGKFIIRGTNNNEKIYSSDGGNWIEGVALPFVTSTVTTTQTFDAPPYQILKPVTKGRVKMYTVDDDDVETIVGWYDPDETVPSYRRFKVPVCPTTP